MLEDSLGIATILRTGTYKNTAKEDVILNLGETYLVVSSYEDAESSKNTQKKKIRFYVVYTPDDVVIVPETDCMISLA